VAEVKMNTIHSIPCVPARFLQGGG
jgi:hypothetical protein